MSRPRLPEASVRAVLEEVGAEARAELAACARVAAEPGWTWRPGDGLWRLVSAPCAAAVEGSEHYAPCSSSPWVEAATGLLARAAAEAGSVPEGLPQLAIRACSAVGRAAAASLLLDSWRALELARASEDNVLQFPRGASSGG